MPKRKLTPKAAALKHIKQRPKQRYVPTSEIAKDPEMHEYVEAVIEEIKAGRCTWTASELWRELKDYFGPERVHFQAKTVGYYIKNVHGGMKVIKHG